MEIYRYKIKVTKLNELKFISHLDWQNLIIKTFRRMGLNLALSQGFNPMPKISFSPALPIFIESECEIIYFETVEALKEDGFSLNFASNISKNAKLLEFKSLGTAQKKPQPLETLVQWANYEATPIKKYPIPIFENIKYNIEKCLLNDNLFIKKINKKGFEKNIDYKSSLKNIEFDEKTEKIIFTLKAGQGSDIPALRADDFLSAVFGEDILFEIKRTRFFDADLKEI